MDNIHGALRDRKVFAVLCAVYVWAWPYTLLQNDIFTLDYETGRNDSGYTTASTRARQR